MISIRPLTPADWPAVARIYELGIASGNATFETEVPGWGEWDAGKRPDCRLAATLEGQVVGWAALSPVSKRAVYAGVAENSIYIDPACQGQGIGKRLLAALVKASEAAGVWTLQTSIFPENEASLHIHEVCGFRVVGRRERIAMHRGLWRDTILLERRAEPHPRDVHK